MRRFYNISKGIITKVNRNKVEFELTIMSQFSTLANNHGDSLHNYNEYY